VTDAHETLQNGSDRHCRLVPEYDTIGRVASSSTSSSKRSVRKRRKGKAHPRCSASRLSAAPLRGASDRPSTLFEGAKPGPENDF
jgi:hypothetical protein